MGVVKEKVAAEYLVVAVVNQSINQSVLFQATRPIHEKQGKEKNT